MDQVNKILYAPNRGRMNADIKKEWVDALRSGDYVQGQSVLRDMDDNYCCLGVLCDIAVQHAVIPEPEQGDRAWYYDEWEDVLPASVANWAGLIDTNGYPNTNPSIGENSLAEMNDNGETFETIADVIDEAL